MRSMRPIAPSQQVQIRMIQLQDSVLNIAVCNFYIRKVPTNLFQTINGWKVRAPVRPHPVYKFTFEKVPTNSFQTRNGRKVRTHVRPSSLMSTEVHDGGLPLANALEKSHSNLQPNESDQTTLIATSECGRMNTRAQQHLMLDRKTRAQRAGTRAQWQQCR